MSGADFTPEGRASARPLVSPPDREALADDKPNRHHPIHLSPLEAHNRSIIIFVTCCTAKRKALLASSSAHNGILGAWAKASAWLVGRYVVLPDHLHFFCAPNGIDAPSLERWMRYWKSRATSIMGRTAGTVWQRDHWDRQLRSGESYDEKWEYVRNNPVRHGYVTNADDWPYQGDLNELRW
jgi:putative transposase